MRVTLLAWIIAKTESSNTWITNASDAVCRHSSASAVNLSIVKEIFIFYFNLEMRYTDYLYTLWFHQSNQKLLLELSAGKVLATHWYMLLGK